MKYFFEWTDELTVNIEEIDSQHKEFISLINDLYISITTGKSSEVLGDILSRLIEYATIHFATEERLMKIHGYSELADHKKEHRELKDNLLELNRRFNRGQSVPTGSVAIFLKNWLKKHIRMTDMKYGSFIKSKGMI